MAKRWEQYEVDFLTANVNKMPHKEIAAHLGREPSAVKAYVSNHKLGRRFRFSEEQIAALKKDYPTTKAEEMAQRFGCSVKAVWNAAKRHGIKKDRRWIAENARQNMLNPHHGGRSSQFQKGHLPFNKGAKGVCYPGCAATQFKKGNLPPTTADVGAFVVNDEGYTKIKIAMPNKWQFYNRYLWEKHTGKKIPRGHAVIFKDGDRRNLSIENLEMISRRELSKRNRDKFNENYPPELKKAFYALTRLNKEINKYAEK